MTDTVITAKDLSKSYGQLLALKPSCFSIDKGQVLGLIGPNGAGKTTLINSLLGLAKYRGELAVLGLDPWRHREDLVRDICFISDVATLPRWMTVRQILHFVDSVHPKFDLKAATKRVKKADLPFRSKVKTLSKGMIVQLHLAICLSIDARLLILDEPTLGLDIINRRSFYDSLLADYFDHNRTIIISSHQVDEIEPILTHVMFIRKGDIMLYETMERLSQDYLALDVKESCEEEAYALSPLYSRSLVDHRRMIFKSVDRETLEKLGTVSQVGLVDIFVCLNHESHPHAS